MGDPDRYLSVDEVDTAVVNLAATYPRLCQLITLPNLTTERRTCHAILLSTAPGTGRRIIMLTGGLHAREWGSCEILVNLAADLLGALTSRSGLGYGAVSYPAAAIQFILGNADILICPLVNPDGRNYSQLGVESGSGDRLWRKNRNPAYKGDSTKATCTGVDINRNFDFLFDFRTKFAPLPESLLAVSDDPCEFQFYHGPAAFSEPETQNVRWLFDQHETVTWFFDVHSYGPDILYAWGDDDDQSADPQMNFQNRAFDGKRGARDDSAYREYIDPSDYATVKDIAQAFCDGAASPRGQRYSPMPSIQLYATSGPSDDYAYSRHLTDAGLGKILSFTIEWGNHISGDATASFQPPWEEMKAIAADVISGLLHAWLDILGRLSVLDGYSGVPALIESNFGHVGNYELVTPRVTGGLQHFYQDNDGSFFWNTDADFGIDQGIVDAAAMIQSSFGPGNLEVIARAGGQLMLFFRDHTAPFAWHGPFPIPTDPASGNPSFIQGNFGSTGNFELVTPLAAGGLAHFSRNNDNSALPWSGAALFGQDIGVFGGAAMIQSSFGPGNLEVIARAGGQLMLFFRDHTAPFAWHGPFPIPTGPVTGNPSFIQGNFGSTGNFELVTPLAAGGLAHFSRNNDNSALPWSGAALFGQDIGVFDAATLIQSRVGLGNLIVVARQGNALHAYARDHTSPFAWHTFPGP